MATPPERTITGFHRDDEGHWVAELSCGHTRHVRHDPPWQVRPWVLTAEGRAAFLGRTVACVECARGPAAAGGDAPPREGASGEAGTPVPAQGAGPGLEAALVFLDDDGRPVERVAGVLTPGPPPLWRPGAQCELERDALAALFQGLERMRVRDEPLRLEHPDGARRYRIEAVDVAGHRLRLRAAVDPD